MGRVAQRPYVKRIMKKIETAVKRGMRDYSYVVHDAMKDAFNTSIDAFYNNYTPTNKYEGRYLVGFNKDGSFRYRKFKYWRRRKSLYQALKTNKHNDVKFKRDGDIFGFSSTIRFSGKNIKVKHHNERQGYHNANEWIFNRAYFNAIHGFTKEEDYNWFDSQGESLNSLGKKNKWHHNIIYNSIGNDNKMKYSIEPVNILMSRQTIPSDNYFKNKNMIVATKAWYSGYAGMTHNTIQDIRLNFRHRKPVDKNNINLIDLIKKYL